MAWVESHQELGQHPKTLKAAKKLGINVPQMVGHLHLLWHWALSYADDGDLSKWDDDDVALGAQWEGDSGEFVRALADVGFIDEADGSRWLHDWMDYAGRLVRERERKRAARSKPQDTDPPPDSTTSDDKPHTDDGASAESPQTGGGQEGDSPRAGTNPTQPTNQPDQPPASADDDADHGSLNGFGSGLPRQPAEGRSLAGTVQDWLAEPPRDHHIRPCAKRSDDYRALIEGVCEHVDMSLERRHVQDVAHRITCEYVAEVRGEPLSDAASKQVRSFIGEYAQKPALALWGLAEAVMHGAGLSGEHAGNPQALPNYARSVIEGNLASARKAAS